MLISVAWDLWTGFWKYWSTSWMNFSGYKIFPGTNDIDSIVNIDIQGWIKDLVEGLLRDLIQDLLNNFHPDWPLLA